MNLPLRCSAGFEKSEFEKVQCKINVKEGAGCPGYIWGESELVKLTVKPATERHLGRQRILIHKNHRGTANRFDVIRVHHGQKSTDVVVIGQRDEEKNVVRLDLDDRKALGIEETGKTYELSIEQLGWIGRYWWYIRARDPAIYLPARIALLSLGLGALGVALGFASLFS
ncbi:hypothetical protein KUV39_09290 [Phaeobacter italicus]|uniref:hypothetical protein n=1 Tax=Phaeobacter italicus TaxID=481446 RepID=UPI001C943E59|nr:hypothetical protein [Phaeobacter italicus]MBY5976838.1 hypothetical protein [Phaeobacter italicus]